MTREQFKVKEFLSGLKDMEIAIRIKLEKLEDMRELAGRVNNSLNEDRVQTSKKYDKLERTAIRIVEYENNIKQEIRNYSKRIEKIKIIINRIPDIVKRNILEMRYINFYKWEDIQKMVNYEESWIRRLHAKSLSEIVKDKKSMKIINKT